jgi:hypothetical protein
MTRALTLEIRCTLVKTTACCLRAALAKTYPMRFATVGIVRAQIHSRSLLNHAGIIHAFQMFRAGALGVRTALIGTWAGSFRAAITETDRMCF